MMPVPYLFRLIQAESGTAWEEMYRVFNMGHRMEFYVPENIADKLVDIAKSFNIDAQVIGHCEQATSKKVSIRSTYGKFDY
jgi:phosphoribosylformylglycinamidine cyclo-ligase